MITARLRAVHGVPQGGLLVAGSAECETGVYDMSMSMQGEL